MNVLPLLISTLLSPNSGRLARPLYQPTTEQLVASYKRADEYGRQTLAKVAMLRLEPAWIDNGKAFWYRKDLVGGGSEFVRVDTSTGAKTALFDAPRLAAALSKEIGKPVEANRLPIRTLRFVNGALRFDTEQGGWELDANTYGLKKVDAEGRPTGRRPRGGPAVDDAPEAPSTAPVTSSDGTWTARIEKGNVLLKAKDGAEVPMTTDATDKLYFGRLQWARDGKHLIGVRVHAGDRNRVYLIQNTPPTWGPARMMSRVYNRPGDVIDTYDVVTFDPATKGSVPSDTIDYGGMPFFRPTKDGSHLVYDKMDRGYGRWRIQSLDPTTGKVDTIVDDDPETFVDSTAQVTEYLRNSDEIVYSSERDGWHHLYLSDGKGGSTQITKGPWVVRGVTKVDEAKRQIVFSASGMDPKEDPYYVHYYRINFDGTGLTPLTPMLGNHAALFAPDGATLEDTYSTPTTPPVHELRNAESGALIATLEKADVSELTKSGWRAPQPFVAKGRDGKTDIYGLVFRPQNFDPKKRYAVVEDIYAGPQDSFVPKSFNPGNYDQSVAELGFIVVKIDGMGTRNRSKAFHDVCYKNLADAGFPDRILWMKALAKTDPSVDLDRVGIFGTSAGGQNAGGAVLFHPEFYTVAVASCGCHDNRLDKIWWNEQWMGTMGPHYAASSNIENAAKLKGDLLLMVGELDTNVPPESTYRYAAALQAAGKEYDLVIIPNSDHTAGGPYGERKRRDFLVRHLLDVTPPNPNR
jgi:dipeptidyl aminopeptidase/acylaminoacyl peptidase